MNASTISGSHTPFNVSLPAAGATNTKPLWAVIGVLGVSVLAMGASLVHINKRPIEPVASAVMPGISAAQKAVMPNTFAAVPIGESIDPSIEKIEEKKPKSLNSIAQAAPKNIAKIAMSDQPARPVKSAVNTATAPAEASVGVPTSVPSVGAAPAGRVAAASPVVPGQTAQAVPVCATCGTVESVTPIVRDGQSSPVGLIAGGVLGAVLGNQVGKGDGRVLGTVAGAAGGAWAGSTIEKKMNKQTVYAVRVRMQDGSSRSLEQANAPAVGAKVTVEGNTLKGEGGAVYAPAAVAATRAPVVQPSTDTNNRGG